MEIFAGSAEQNINLSFSNIATNIINKSSIAVGKEKAHGRAKYGTRYLFR